MITTPRITLTELERESVRALIQSSLLKAARHLGIDLATVAKIRDGKDVCDGTAALVRIRLQTGVPAHKVWGAK